MPQIPLKESFREPRKTPDYFCHLYFSFSLQSEISPLLREKSNYFSFQPQELCVQLSEVRGVISWNEARLASCGLKCSCAIFRRAKLPLCGSKHNAWCNYEATITQARPDVIDRPSDRRVRGQMSGVRVQLGSLSLGVCVCMHCCVSCPLEEEDADS